MKVLLINPPTLKNEIWFREGRCQQFDIWGSPFPPLSLGSIAGQLRGVAETRIIDAGAEGLGIKEALKKVENFLPDVIIISSATPTIQNDLDLFSKKVKGIAPEVKICAIGVHVSVFPKEVLEEFPAVDFIIIGEPEMTARDFISALKEKGDIEKVPSLAFRKNGVIFINLEKRFVENLDELNMPDWTGINFSCYKMPIIGKPFTFIIFARGCPFHCKFCNASVYYGRKIRKRSPEKIIEEINWHIRQGIFDFLFWTESVTGDKNYLTAVLDAIILNKLQKKIRWVANSRVDSVDLEILKKLKEAGCWQIVFGLEFGNDEILKLAQKGGEATVEQGRKAVEMADRAGFVVDGHFIMGYPGETEKTLKDTINFALSLPLTFAQFYSAVPFPGSELYKESLEKNFIVSNDWTEFSQGASNLKTNEFEPEIVQKYISLAYKKFYLRPRTILKIAKIAKTIPQFLNIVKLGSLFTYHSLRR